MTNRTTEKYIGRFAPSPTGPLHFGSLVTAVASYYQAKSNNGKWLVRIEDIDSQRNIPGASKSILSSLEAFQLYWDDEICYQSERQNNYTIAITKLINLNKIYRCLCSRKSIQRYRETQQQTIKHQNSNAYPGICRDKQHPDNEPHNLRLIVPEQPIQFNDTLQGIQNRHCNLTGDFVVQQSSGLATYQLAVAIDDALFNVTEVVRGVDLIDSTAKQILILSLLNYPIPQYCHIPVVCHADGSKLSKQTGATPLDNNNTTPQLWQALSFLCQNPPPELKQATIQELHSWTKQSWDINKISIKHNSLFYQ